MDIRLIRHTKTACPKGICYGQHDVELDPAFDNEWPAVVAKLPLSFDQVYSSPLQRCRRLAEKFSSEIEFDERLKELDYGQWEMKKWDEIDRLQIDQWAADFEHIRVPGGESFGDVRRRAREFLQDVISSRHKSVAVVTHAGFIRTLLTDILGMPLQNAYHLALDFGSVSCVTVDGDTYKLKFLNT